MSRTRVASPVPSVQVGDYALAYAAAPRDDRVSVREFLLFLWRSRWHALIGAVLCAATAAAASWIATPKYTASVVMLPVSSREEGGLGSLGSAVSQLGGIASLAGLNLGGAETAKSEALATLDSQALTDEFIRQHDLLPILFPKQWDPVKKAWRGGGARKAPTLWEANQVFHGIRAVDDNPKTGLLTLTVRWTDPNVAAAWANGLVNMTNDYLRQKTIDQADRSIAYLDQEVSKTNIVEVKNAIYGLMEDEIKKEMVARGRRDFALKVIDPAVAPEKESFPRPLLWTIGGALAGLFLGLLVSVLRETMMDEEAGGERRQIRPPLATGAPAAQNSNVEQS